MTDTAPTTAEDKADAVHAAASKLYGLKPHWLTFFREVFGVGGMVSRAYPTVEEREEFEGSMCFLDLQTMLSELRANDVEEQSKVRTAVITVRLPVDIHEALKSEARRRDLSLNKLCIAKLLAPFSED